MPAEAPPTIEAPPPETGLNPPPARGSAKESLFANLNKIAKEPTVDKDAVPPAPGQKKPTAVKEPPKAPVKETPKEPVKPEDKPAEPKLEEQPKLEEKPVEQPKGAKKPSDFLREELAKQKARAEALEAEVKQYKTPKEDPEKKTLLEKLAAEEKRRKEYEDELRFTNYERSPEFKEKFVKPYETAWADAISDLEETVVPNADGTMRKATKDDLMKIVNLPIQQAGELAEQLFGKAERTMMDHRSALLKTWKAQQQGLAEGRKNAEQREKQLMEQQKQQQAELRKLQTELRTSNEPEFLKRYPELVLAKNDKDEPLDPEGQKLLDQDRSVTDKLFDENTEWSPEHKLKMHAEMRNRAAHFSTVLRAYRRAVTELAEANKKIAEYQQSEPGKGEGNNEVLPELKAATTMTSMMEKLKSIARPGSGAPTS